jgi:hypothetical protein
VPYIAGMSEYDENCGRLIVIDPTNINQPLQFAGQQDYIAIPGKTLKATFGYGMGGSPI